jgi:predicted RNA-binding protein with PIN domain
MAATFLIDGYNLIHAMGLLPGRVGPGGLEKARLGLLGLLHASFGTNSSSVTVVFDASRAPPGAEAEQDHSGIHVRFALGRQEADDLIEELLRHASDPKHVTMVSDDHRLQQAARRRQAEVMGCNDFLDWLLQERRKNRTAPFEETEKVTGMTADEKRQWLEEFSNLENDPEFKDLFERFGLEDEDLV